MLITFFLSFLLISNSFGQSKKMDQAMCIVHHWQKALSAGAQVVNDGGTSEEGYQAIVKVTQGFKDSQNSAGYVLAASGGVISLGAVYSYLKSKDFSLHVTENFMVDSQGFAVMALFNLEKYFATLLANARYGKSVQFYTLVVNPETQSHVLSNSSFWRVMGNIPEIEKKLDAFQEGLFEMYKDLGDKENPDLKSHPKFESMEKLAHELDAWTNTEGNAAKIKTTISSTLGRDAMKKIDPYIYELSSLQNEVRTIKQSLTKWKIGFTTLRVLGPVSIIFGIGYEMYSDVEAEDVTMDDFLSMKAPDLRDYLNCHPDDVDLIIENADHLGCLEVNSSR